jgi:hypothetical protein
LLGPDPEQLLQVLSQDWQVLEVLSKNWFLLQVGRHRPLVRTGRFDGQEEHWLKAPPEQVAQSGWQVMHLPEELNVFEGHEATHDPLEASWLFAQVRQKVEDPAQVLHEESHATMPSQKSGLRQCNNYIPVQVRLSVGERKVPVGQLSTHLPLESTKPGKQPVHCA